MICWSFACRGRGPFDLVSHVPVLSDSAVEYVIAVAGGGFSVSGRDRDDGEAFVITDTTWHGYVLRFTALMPSTCHCVRHAARLLPGTDVVEDALILRERWKRAPGAAAPRRSMER